MENLPVNGGNGQSFGYILYETSITSSGVLSGRVRDRGQVGASLLNSRDLLMSSPAICSVPQNQLFPAVNMALPSQLCESSWGHSFLLCPLAPCLPTGMWCCPSWPSGGPTYPPPVGHGCFCLFPLAGVCEHSIHRILGLQDNEDRCPSDPGSLFLGAG